MTSANPTSHRPRLLVGWSWLVGVLLLSQPLQSADLWWDLARGREVLNGALRPAQELLTLDNASEAAWLGGVPFFELWSLGGIFALAAVPLLVGLLIARVVSRSAATAQYHLAIIVALPLLLIATRTDLEPTAWLFDLFGLLATWAVLRRCRSRRAMLVGLGFVFAIWANLGPRPLWGLLLVILWPAPIPVRGRALLITLLAGMFTPRGPLTWLDSTVLFAPMAFSPVSELLDARWRGVTLESWNAPLVAASLLWILATVHTWHVSAGRLSLARFAMLAVPLAAVLLAQHNLAPASLWIVLWWLSAETRSPSPADSQRTGWIRPALLAMTALAVADACGALGPGSTPLGWGLSQAIDPRLLQVEDSISGDEPVIGWASDSRSAGVAAWVGRKTKIVDHPVRALLGGRLGLHAELRQDLLTGHQWRYRRDNNTWGGWAHVLRNWRAQMLFVSSEDAGLHQALIETPWKLVKLDSPTVPYASAETPRFDRAIVDVMRQQSLVEAGAWQPALDIYDPQGWRIEAATLLGLLPSPAPAIRQAGFFRAIQLPMAALRSLAPLRPAGGTRAVRTEFLRCQAALARDEWTTAGRVSRFRQLVLKSNPSALEGRSEPWLPATDDATPASDAWSNCLALYLDGRPIEAAAALPGATAEEQYTRGLLWVEAGEIEQARGEFLAAAGSSDPGVEIAAKYWLEQVAPANHDATAQTH